MRQTKTLRLALALALFAGATTMSRAEDAAIGPLRIVHAWAPATPDGAKEAPGYFTITNTGSVADRLVSGSFADAGRVEIVAGAGKAAKAIAGGLVVAPGETVTLSPSGPHLMFTSLIGPLERGQTAQSILRFERAGAGVVEFAIEGAAKAGKGTHRGH